MQSPRAWLGAGAALAGILAIALLRPGGWWAGDGGTATSAPSAVVPAPTGSPLPSPSATPLLEPPTAPTLPAAASAPPDAYVGQWGDAGGNRLTVRRTAPDRYALVLAYAGDGGSETYDGIVSDGRVHFTRGIDGDWLQVRAGDRPCLYLGISGEVYCKAG
ncbi:hypothetical protein V5740_12940 [Croceibacterium sp. TMG7-5b_MA50]|uniref:hypothetical protein n=1 Tax=Croceibacterium sp. TMG7-5b_MA50 TaxID=3121290 RepID=UPI0032214169